MTTTVTKTSEDCNTCKILPDLQNQEDIRGVEIDRVGIEGVNFPIKVKVKPEAEDKAAKSVPVSASVKLFVGLPKNYKGVNMSRFMQTLLEFRETHNILSSFTMPELLNILRDKMKSKDAYARFEFDYYVNVKAPVSKLEAPQRYRCAFTGIKKNGDYDFILEVNVIAASVCPCSREMSLLENLDNLRNGFDVVTISNKVGQGAHNQRSNIKVEVIANKGETIWIEDLIKLVEANASAPVFPVLKRPDEKFVTEFGYNNAKFSEDITRDVHLALDKLGTLYAWNLKIANEESIHLYNAVCHHKSEKWMYHL